MTWDFEASYGHAVEAYRRNPDESRRANVKRIEAHIAGGATLENMPPGVNGTMTPLRCGADPREAAVDWGRSEPKVRLAFGD